MKNNKKSQIFFYLFNFFIVLIVSGMTLSKILKENNVETFSYLSEIGFYAIIILTFIFFFNYYMEGIIISISMKEYKDDFTPRKGFVVQCVGGLFSAITPLKIGYFPSLAYAYSRFKVKPDQLIKSMSKTSFPYQLLCIIISVVSLITCISRKMIVEIGIVNLDLKYVAIIGLVYNLVLLIGFFILILSPKLHRFLFQIISWVLVKLKKIGCREEYLNFQEEKMSLIRKEIKKYFTNFKEVFIIFFLYLIKSVVFGSLPYIIYLLIFKQPFKIELLLYTIVLGHLISYITNIIPIPGASGAAEVVFISVFSLVFTPKSLLTSVMLIWRVFSYFINIIVGFVVFVVMINIKKKK